MLAPEEARRAVAERPGFGFALDNPQKRLGERQFDPVQRQYSYAEQRTAAEDAAYVFFDLWQTPLEAWIKRGPRSGSDKAAEKNSPLPTLHQAGETFIVERVCLCILSLTWGETMPVVDVLFPVLGTTIPTDHAYPLYKALTDLVPAFHEDGSAVRFAPISGQYGGTGLIRLYERSRLRIRLLDAMIRQALPLAGKALVLAEHRIRLGVPHVRALVPAPCVAARLVTFKHSTTVERFREVARQKLDEMGVRGELEIPVIQSGRRRGEPRRQVLRIKGTRVIGFALRVKGLTEEESLLLQEKGLGGRTRMGCGFFVAVHNGGPES